MTVATRMRMRTSGISVLDTYTDTTGTTLTSHTPEKGGPITLAPAFSSGTAQITDLGRVRNSTNNTAVPLYAPSTPSSDIDISFDFVKRTSVSGTHGTVWSYNTSTNDCYAILYSVLGGQMIMRRITAGVLQGTNLIVWSIVPGVANDTPRTVAVKVRGALTEMRVDGTLRGSYTDPSPLGGGRFGLYMSAASPSDTVNAHLDNFSATA